MKIFVNNNISFFNLIPIPPLDGGKIAMGLLPHPLAVLLSKLESWGLILMFLLLSSGTVSSYLSPVINFATTRLCHELYSGESTATCPLLRGDFESIEKDSTDQNSLPQNPATRRTKPTKITDGTKGTQI